LIKPSPTDSYVTQNFASWDYLFLMTFRGLEILRDGMCRVPESNLIGQGNVGQKYFKNYFLLAEFTEIRQNKSLVVHCTSKSAAVLFCKLTSRHNM
jgi:hypothetical protein